MVFLIRFLILLGSPCLLSKGIVSFIAVVWDEVYFMCMIKLSKIVLILDLGEGNS